VHADLTQVANWHYDTRFEALDAAKARAAALAVARGLGACPGGRAGSEGRREPDCLIRRPGRRRRAPTRHLATGDRPGRRRPARVLHHRGRPALCRVRRVQWPDDRHRPRPEPGHGQCLLRRRGRDHGRWTGTSRGRLGPQEGAATCKPHRTRRAIWVLQGQPFRALRAAQGHRGRAANRVQRLRRRAPDADRYRAPDLGTFNYQQVRGTTPPKPGPDTRAPHVAAFYAERPSSRTVRLGYWVLDGRGAIGETFRVYRARRLLATIRGPVVESKPFGFAYLEWQAARRARAPALHLARRRCRREPQHAELGHRLAQQPRQAPVLEHPAACLALGAVVDGVLLEVNALDGRRADVARLVELVMDAVDLRILRPALA
jgi:hypothetical protein